MASRSLSSQPRSAALRAIEGGHLTPSPVNEVRIARTAGRNERHEPWALPADATVQALEDVAARSGLDLDLAARLTVECSLVVIDLLRLGTPLEAPDAAARTAAVSLGLEGQHAAYLRRLHMGSPRPARKLALPVSVGLPARLSTRLIAADLRALVDAADLARALAWETAALIEGRTMSEWAALAALARR